MATSDIDQKILCQIAKDAGRTNPLLSSAFYRILGLSVILSRKLYRARKLRPLDTTRDTKSVALYHQIIWLSREGLAITEVMILPYCQNGSQSPRCRVMAAKLRASFYHVFCLFHNHPPISQLTPPKTSPNGKTDTTTNRPSTDTRARQAVLRETIPSMTSDASYVTNPYAFTGPAQTSPPPYPPPPVPTIQSLVPGTPLRPPGLGMTSPVQRSPPSSADFLMPPLNFVPAASAYFSQATVLARRLLPGSDPLRLSVAFESCAFSWECGKDFALAKEKAKATIRDAIAAIAKRSDSTQVSSRSPTPLKKVSPHSSPSSSPTQGAVSKPASLRSPRPRRPRSRQSQKSIRPSSRKREKMPAATVTETKTSTPEKTVDQTELQKVLPDPPPAPPPKEKLPDLPRGSSPASRKSPRRPRANSKTSQQSKVSSGTTMSEKERKRRIVEQAEERIRRRNNPQSQSKISGR